MSPTFIRDGHNGGRNSCAEGILRWHASPVHMNNSRTPKSTIYGFQHILMSIIAMAATGLLGCSRPDTKSMEEFLDKVSQVPESELSGLLYGYGQLKPGAQKVLVGMLRPLRAPSPNEHIIIEAVRESGRFTMIVARVPWMRNSQPTDLLPIIVAKSAGHQQIVGFVLPFDDTIPLFSEEDLEKIHGLSLWWIRQYGQKGRVSP